MNKDTKEIIYFVIIAQCVGMVFVGCLMAPEILRSLQRHRDVMLSLERLEKQIDELKLK